MSSRDNIYGAYGVTAWTCGRCGERYESSGVTGDTRVDRWRSHHMKEHRVADMSPEERQRHNELEAESFKRQLSWLSEASAE